MAETSDKHALIRGLGLVAAISVIIGNIIGTGVFLKARVITCNVGSPGWVIAGWVAAFADTVPLARLFGIVVIVTMAAGFSLPVVMRPFRFLWRTANGEEMGDAARPLRRMSA